VSALSGLNNRPYKMTVFPINSLNWLGKLYNYVYSTIITYVTMWHNHLNITVPFMSKTDWKVYHVLTLGCVIYYNRIDNANIVTVS